MSLFPEDSAARKEYPVFSGFVQYFPAAIVAVARHSWLGNQKHNPGQPLHWDRSKSDDEADADFRHLMESDLVGHAWRAMALLQKDLESKGAPVAPAARNLPTPATIVNPATVALIERMEEAESAVDGLKAGEAYEPQAYDSHPLARLEGDAVANGPLNFPRGDEE